MRKVVFLTLIVMFMFSISSYALRIQRPRHFTYPLTESDVSELNSMFDDLFAMQQGRYELDKVTASKNAANTGEMWIKQTGGLNYLEVMVDGTVYSISL